MVRIFILVWFAVGILPAFAQQQAGWVNLSGRVLQANSKVPLTSVSVVARPSRSGTTTLLNGIFKLKAKPGDTVTFSSIGFENAMYLVSKNPIQANILILLAEKSTELKEVEINTRPSAEKIARALRNQKRKPEPDPIKAPPAPKPLFAEKPTVAVKPSAYNNPASFLYDKYSRAGKERQQMQAIQEYIQNAKRDSIKRKKEEEYDNLFLDHNEPFKNPYYRRW